MATTLDPAHTYNGALSNANLTMTSSAANGQSWSTTSHSTGKWHVEVTIGSISSPGNHGFGFCASNVLISAGIGADTAGTSIGLYTGSGATTVALYWKNAIQSSFPAGAWVGNSTVAIEIDFGAQLIWFQTSGTGQWNNSATANPATGTGGISFSGMITSGANCYFGVGPYVSGYAQTVNFGATTFAVTPSSGFNAWQGAAAPVTKNPAALMVGV